jgi:hypothetical protein
LRDTKLDESFLPNEQPESGFFIGGHSFPSATRQRHSFYRHPVRNHSSNHYSTEKFCEARLRSSWLRLGACVFFNVACLGLRQG